MSVKFSSGLITYLLETGSLKAALDDGFIRVYGGTVPATADAALGGAPLLLEISTNDTATGLTWSAGAATSTGDSLEKGSAVWSGTSEAASASNPATFFRIVGPDADAGGASTTLRRVQGTVASSGTPDFFMSNTTIPNATLKTLAAFSITLPFSA